MGFGIPQVITETKASGAQVINGSLRFDGSSVHHLKRTFSAGNRKTWTWSGWVRRDGPDSNRQMLFTGDVSNVNSSIEFNNDSVYVFDYDGSFVWQLLGTAKYRDTGWYHYVVALDTTQSTDANRVKIYINGDLETDFSTTSYPSLNYEGSINEAKVHNISGLPGSDSFHYSGLMAQVYFIDGQALGPEYFGFTDPLTNTWRPKKYEGTFGTNGFYLPMDGNTPIGEDKSGVTTINDGTIWSNDVTTSNGYSDNRGPSKGFDGISSLAGSSNTYVQSDTSAGGTVTWTPNGYTIDTADGILVKGISSVDRLSVVGSLGSQSNIAPATVNGITNVYTIPTNLGTLTSLTVTGNNSLAGWSGISVGGTLLVDGLKGNNWTPVNFGGSVSLDNPIVSGARPILNTTPGGTSASVGVFGSRQNVGYAVTVYNDGGGNKFYIDGVKTASITGLIRGATYTFDTSDSTVGSSHPFRLSATSNGTHGGGSEYTDGVVAITGTATTITIPHDAPNTLYYYCTSHSGMGNDSSISIITNEKLADQYASKCVLAISGTESILDSSALINCTTSTKSTNDAGSIAYNSNSNYYGKSIYSAGSTNQYFTVGSSTESDFDMTGDFTIEFWHYPVTSGYNTHARAFYFGNTVSTSGGQFVFYDNNIDISSGTSGLFNGTPFYGIVNHKFDQWNHHAITREGNILRYFQNGVLLEQNTQITPTGIASGNRTLYIGGDDYKTPQYWQDFRIYKGVAKYTENFVPASTNPDILPDTPSGVSGGSKLTKITDGAVSFPGANGDELTLTSTELTQLGSSDWTIECFHYSTRDFAGGTGVHLVQCWDTGWAFTIGDSTGDRIDFVYKKGGTTYEVKGSTPLVSGKWYHLAVSRSGNTIRVFVDGIEDGSATESGSIDSSSSTTLTIGNHPSSSSYNTYGHVSNLRIVKGTALYTSNFTPSTEPLTNVTNTKLLCCQSNKKAYIASVVPGTSLNDGTVWSSNGGGNLNASSSWANVFNGVVPTNNSSLSDVAAVEGSGNTSTITFSPAISGTIRVRISSSASSGTINGSISLSDSSSVSADVYPNSATWKSFGSKSNITSLTINAGTNGGCRLSAIEVDGFVLIDGHSGETVNVYADAAATNFNPFNTDINTVRGQETGYATWNPLVPLTYTLSDGNLTLDFTSGSNNLTHGTIPVSSGKWFWEVTVNSGSVPMIGICESTATLSGMVYTQLTALYYYQNGRLYGGLGRGGDASNTTYGESFTSGDVIGIALDLDNGNINFFNNGVDQGIANQRSGTTYSLVGKSIFPVNGNGGGTANTTTNFGQKPFKFPPPDGYQPINAANVRPEKVFARPDQYVGVTTYSGNATTQHIDVGLRPDFVWIKERTDSGGVSHYLGDTVRGINKSLQSNTTQTESTDNANGYVSSVDDKGFTVTQGSSDSFYTNGNPEKYVAWAWKAGGNKNTFNVDDVGYATASAAGLTAGTITPTGSSVGTKQGFSVIKYTGTGSVGTVPHGLNSAPDFMILKNRDNTQNWQIYHSGIGATKYFNFSTANTYTNSNRFNDTEPTSSVFTLGTAPGLNANTNSYIAYIWHDVPGLQKFGRYQGNGDADGPFIELGFRPAVIILKNDTNAGNNWWIIDSERSKYNGQYAALFPNLSGAENNTSAVGVDFLSNGFKCRGSDGGQNPGSGNSFVIYAAWAEVPTFNLYGAQANSR